MDSAEVTHHCPRCRTPIGAPVGQTIHTCVVCGYMFRSDQLHQTQCPCGRPATRALRLTITTLSGSEPPREFGGSLCERHYERTAKHGEQAAVEILGDLSLPAATLPRQDSGGN